jgi:DNA-binding MarR family transcriptional regulator
VKKVSATVDTGPQPKIHMVLEIHADSPEHIPRLVELAEKLRHTRPTVKVSIEPEDVLRIEARW